ncbi:MAG: hypothetical protein ACODAB_07265 [Gemmatimonadota bacterium]
MASKKSDGARRRGGWRTRKRDKKNREQGRRAAAKQNKGAAKAVTPEKYAEMFRAYSERQSIEHVAKTCGVSRYVAKRAIEKGWTRSAMPPLRDRHREAMAKANKRAEYDLAEAQRQSITVLRAYKAKLAQKVRKLEVDDLPATLGGELDRMVRLEQLLLGGPDSRSAMLHARAVDDEVERMTHEERMEFLRTGKLPERALGAQARVRQDDTEGG